MAKKLSIAIPARNEEESLKKSIEDILSELKLENIDTEIIIVNDNSKDNTAAILKELESSYPGNIRPLNLPPPGGFGRAISLALANVKGDVVVTAMADASDDPKDIVRYFRLLEKGNYDCAFGSRFIKGSTVKDYPRLKLVVNRMANAFIRFLFGINYNDTTNGFKAYKREVIEHIMPLHAVHFNMTVEMPLKAINRGYKYATIPISWYGRTSGVSKHKIRILGKKYLYTVLTLWLERLLLSDELRKKS